MPQDKLILNNVYKNGSNHGIININIGPNNNNPAIDISIYLTKYI